MTDAPQGRYYHREETLPRAALAALQEERILKIVPYAYDRSALTREIWDKASAHPSQIRSLADFTAKAPFLSKADIREYRDRHGDPFGGLLCVDPAQIHFMGTSGGTTGDPTIFPGKWGDADGHDSPRPGRFGGAISAFNAAHQRDLWELGARPGDYGIQMGARIRGPLFRAFQEIGICPILIGAPATEFPRFIELCLQYRPTILYALHTGPVLELEKFADEEGIDLKEVFASFRGVIFGGERMGAHIRQLFQRWDVADRVLEMSAFGDLANSGIFECHERAGCHIWEDLGFAEVLDPVTGEAVPDGGRGELITTSLANDTDPLIRFRSGDIVELTRKPCACGRTHGRMKTLGRVADETVVKGRVVMPLDVWSAIERVEETSQGIFQIIRPARVIDQLSLRVGYRGSPDLTALSRRLADAVEADIRLRPRVELLPTEELLKLGPPHNSPDDGRLEASG